VPLVEYVDTISEWHVDTIGEQHVDDLATSVKTCGSRWLILRLEFGFQGG
jgi:hypothetical protein